MADTKHLRQRHNVWFFQYRLPRPLFEKYGKKIYTETLETSDLREARRRRDLVLSRLRAEQDALSGVEVSPFVRREVFRQAAAFMEEEEIARDQGLSLVEILEPEKLGTLEQDAFKLAFAGSETKVGIKQKYRVTLREGLKDWLQEVSRKPTTASKNTRSVDLFLDFLGEADVQLKRVSRQNVRDFISDQLSLEKTRQTVQNYLSGLSAVFNHSQEHLEDDLGANPFNGHKLNAKADINSYDIFRQAEELAILEATKDDSGSDFLLPRLGAYSGARISELVNLRLSDLVEQQGVLCIRVREGKTANATRLIPVHSHVLKQVVNQMEFARKQGSERLFPEAEKVRRVDGNTAAYFSQRFSRVRRRVVPSEGRKLGFHSFRTSFITALFRAGVPEQDVVWVTGHERGLTTAFLVYNRGPSLVRLQEIVEAFSLDYLDA